MRTALAKYFFKTQISKFAAIKFILEYLQIKEDQAAVIPPQCIEGSE